MLVLTIDDRDGQITLDDVTEGEATGRGLHGVDEDDVGVFELVSGEGFKCRSRASAGGHCKERCGKRLKKTMSCFVFFLIHHKRELTSPMVHLELKIIQ